MSYEVKIERLNHSGEGISKIDGKVTFISKTVFDDVVEVEIIDKNKNYNRGIVTKYKRRNNEVVEPRCEYYYKCGGCQISNLNYSKQLEYKIERVKDIFKKYLDKDIDWKIISSDNKLGYRNKITLQIKDGKLGLFDVRSNNLVDISKCLLVSKKVNKVIDKLKKIDLTNVNNIIIRENYSGIMLIVNGDISLDELSGIISDLDTVIINNKVIKGKGYIVEKLGDLKFIISSNSFFQVNTKQAINLYNKVQEYANLKKDDTVIDLYCGTGTIGIFLARYCKKVIGVEINENAISDAKENLRINNIKNVQFICGDVSKIINNKYKANVIVVDPPRSGLDKNTRRVLLQILPEKIVYVSCDTMTLVRDLKDFLDKYKLEKGMLVDMFPQTYHVENVVLLKRIS